MEKENIKIFILKKWGQSFKKRKGSSVALFLIMLVCLSISLISILPIATKMAEGKTNTSINVKKCIFDNDYTSWYNSETGVTSLPAEGTSCYAAVLDTEDNRGGALNTSIWFAENGNENQKPMAKKILRAACDQGGEKACDYFINTCIKSGNSSSDYCDDTSSFEDLAYYLHYAKDTGNQAATYVYNQLKILLPQMKVNLLNAVNNACSNNQFPNNNLSPDNQNLNNNLAFNLKGNWIYITGCNLGYGAACAVAHDNNFNKSCSQIKAAWPDAPTDIYKLTYKYDGTSESLVSAKCGMSSTASAAITGCNAVIDPSYNCTSSDSNANCSNDCFIGYYSGYNQSCEQIFSSWTQSSEDVYNLTSAGESSINLTSTSCKKPTNPAPPPPPAPELAPLPNCGHQLGERLPNETIYAGQYNGYCYYTTREDEPAGAYPKKYMWGTGGHYLETATSTSDGMANTNALVSSGYYDVEAASVCDTKDDGYTDWYLPSLDELIRLVNNKDKIGGFSNSTDYWSSTQWNSYYGYAVSTSGGSGNKGKTEYTSVRCIRKEPIH